MRLVRLNLFQRFIQFSFVDEVRWGNGEAAALGM
jgi:hypothetical protein